MKFCRRKISISAMSWLDFFNILLTNMCMPLLKLSRFESILASFAVKNYIDFFFTLEDLPHVDKYIIWKMSRHVEKTKKKKKLLLKKNQN